MSHAQILSLVHVFKEILALLGCPCSGNGISAEYDPFLYELWLQGSVFPVTINGD